MKKATLIVILLSAVISASSQDGLIGINLGISLPKSDFGSTTSLFSSGHALSGFSIEFDGSYFPVSFAGAGGVLGFGSLITNSDSYLDNLVNYLNMHSELVNMNIPVREQFSSSAGFWNYVNLLGGPEISARVGQIRAGVRAMGGFSLILCPKREIVYDSGTDMIKATSGGNDISLIYMYGANITYLLGSGTALKLSGEYYNTRADFSFDLEADSPLVSYSESLKEATDIQYLVLSLGFSYSF